MKKIIIILTLSLAFATSAFAGRESAQSIKKRRIAMDAMPAGLAKQCYKNGVFQGFPCNDGGRHFTSEGHSTLGEK